MSLWEANGVNIFFLIFRGSCRAAGFLGPMLSLILRRIFISLVKKLFLRELLRLQYLLVSGFFKIFAVVGTLKNY
jgi:hypothetical protein